jgi:hypothetical protein
MGFPGVYERRIRVKEKELTMKLQEGTGRNP